MYVSTAMLSRRLGDADDPELRSLPPAIAVHGERAGEMHRRALEPDERLAELLARGAERDSLDRPPVARDGAQAQVVAAGPDGRRLRQTMTRQGEHRLRRARAIGAGRLQAMDEFRRRRVRRQRRVDLE